MTTIVRGSVLERVSVKDFGAVGDGVTDDTAAINAWTDYLEANDRAGYIPAGNYLTTEGIAINVDKLRLYGDGREISIINFEPNSGSFDKGIKIGTMGGGQDLSEKTTLEDFSIVSTPSNTFALYGIWAHKLAFNSRIANVGVDGVQATSIHLEDDPGNVLIENCLLEGRGVTNNGIVSNLANGVSIKNNQIHWLDNLIGVGVDLDQYGACEITGNAIEGGGGGSDFSDALPTAVLIRRAATGGLALKSNYVERCVKGFDLQGLSGDPANSIDIECNKFSGGIEIGIDCDYAESINIESNDFQIYQDVSTAPATTTTRRFIRSTANSDSFSIGQNTYATGGAATYPASIQDDSNKFTPVNLSALVDPSANPILLVNLANQTGSSALTSFSPFSTDRRLVKMCALQIKLTINTVGASGSAQIFVKPDSGQGNTLQPLFVSQAQCNSGDTFYSHVTVPTGTSGDFQYQLVISGASWDVDVDVRQMITYY